MTYYEFQKNILYREINQAKIEKELNNWGLSISLISIDIQRENLNKLTIEEASKEIYPIINLAYYKEILDV